MVLDRVGVERDVEGWALYKRAGEVRDALAHILATPPLNPVSPPSHARSQRFIEGVASGDSPGSILMVSVELVTGPSNARHQPVTQRSGVGETQVFAHP